LEMFYVTIAWCWSSWTTLEIKFWQLDALESNLVLKQAKRCKTMIRLSMQGSSV
jgi:hypothetical protein